MRKKRDSWFLTWSTHKQSWPCQRSCTVHWFSWLVQTKSLQVCPPKIRRPEPKRQACADSTGQGLNSTSIRCCLSPFGSLEESQRSACYLQLLRLATKKCPSSQKKSVWCSTRASRKLSCASGRNLNTEMCRKKCCSERTDCVDSQHKRRCTCHPKSYAWGTRLFPESKGHLALLVPLQERAYQIDSSRLKSCFRPIVLILPSMSLLRYICKVIKSFHF